MISCVEDLLNNKSVRFISFLREVITDFQVGYWLLVPHYCCGHLKAAWAAIQSECPGCFTCVFEHQTLAAVFDMVVVIGGAADDRALKIFLGCFCEVARKFELLDTQGRLAVVFLLPWSAKSFLPIGLLACSRVAREFFWLGGLCRLHLVRTRGRRHVLCLHVRSSSLDVTHALALQLFSNLTADCGLTPQDFGLVGHDILGSSVMLLSRKQTALVNAWQQEFSDNVTIDLEKVPQALVLLTGAICSRIGCLRRIIDEEPVRACLRMLLVQENDGGFQITGSLLMTGPFSFFDINIRLTLARRLEEAISDANMAASAEICDPLPAERLSNFGLASNLDVVCLRGERRPILKAAMVLMLQEAEYVENACVHLTKRRRIGERKPHTEPQQATIVPSAVGIARPPSLVDWFPQFGAIWDGAQVVMEGTPAVSALKALTGSGTLPRKSSQQLSTAPASPRMSSLEFPRACFESSSVDVPEIRGVDEVPEGEEIPAIPSPSSLASPVTTLQTAHSARRYTIRLSDAEKSKSPCETATLPVFSFDLESEADELLQAFSMISD